jgi:hypothetical protein
VPALRNSAYLSGCNFLKSGYHGGHHSSSGTLMRPEFVYIRCPSCARVYRTTAGLCVEKLAAMLPVLQSLTATCPYCQTEAKVREELIASPRLGTKPA